MSSMQSFDDLLKFQVFNVEVASKVVTIVEKCLKILKIIEYFPKIFFALSVFIARLRKYGNQTFLITFENTFKFIRKRVY